MTTRRPLMLVRNPHFHCAKNTHILPQATCNTSEKRR